MLMTSSACADHRSSIPRTAARRRGARRAWGFARPAPVREGRAGGTDGSANQCDIGSIAAHDHCQSNAAARFGRDCGDRISRGRSRPKKQLRLRLEQGARRCVRTRPGGSLARIRGSRHHSQARMGRHAHDSVIHERAIMGGSGIGGDTNPRPHRRGSIRQLLCATILRWAIMAVVRCLPDRIIRRLNI